MWEISIFGHELYNVVSWFIVYSVLGWGVESIYMSICNRKLTNRGFARGPFCPIYGVGALTVYFALDAYSDNKVILFILGAIFATAIEFVTALIMQRIFGEVWWDYHDKPFNYKGILCLESTIAWGFYTILLFMVLQNVVMDIVKSVPVHIGRFGGGILLVVFFVDFATALYKEKKDTIVQWKKNISERFL